jgi:SAM-dependent methyltransferase
MIETITYKGNRYPKFQSQGYASKFAIPYAQEVCKGVGVDVGCAKAEWSFPGSYPVDPALNEWDALNFPYENLDYIFSSHCLEHLQNWVDVLDYWTSKLKKGGVLFLYLPDYSQVYWRPWNNRKHINIFNQTIIRDYMEDRGYGNIFTSGVDLYNAFMVFGEKNK